MKDMLKTLLRNGNITKGDIINALYESEDTFMNEVKIPKIIFREKRNDYLLNVPAKVSPTGKRFQISGKSEEEVIEKFKEALVIKPGVPTLAKYGKKILLLHYYGNVKPTTYDNYDSIFRCFIEERGIGNKPINEITSIDLTLYFKDITNGKYSKTTVCTTKAILNTIFKYAVRDKWLVENPIDFTRITFKNCKKEKEGIETFSFEDLKKIESLIESGWDGNKTYGKSARYHTFYILSPMFLVMAYSGMRLGEALSLKLEDIDVDNATIYIHEQVSEYYERDKNGERLRKVSGLSDPKTEHSVRKTVLTERALHWIKVIVARRKEIGLITSPDALLITNRFNKFVTKNTVGEILNRLLIDAGIEPRTSHKFRKTFVTNGILYSGDDLSINDVSRLVGHKNITTTLNTYFKTTGSTDTKAKAKKFDDIFVINSSSVSNQKLIDKLKVIA